MVRRLRIYTLLCLATLLAISLIFHTCRNSKPPPRSHTEGTTGHNLESVVEEWLKTFRINQRWSQLKEDHKDQVANGSLQHNDTVSNHSEKVQQMNILDVKDEQSLTSNDQLEAQRLSEEQSPARQVYFSPESVNSTEIKQVQERHKRHIGDFLSEKEHFIYTVLSHVGIEHELQRNTLSIEQQPEDPNLLPEQDNSIPSQYMHLDSRSQIQHPSPESKETNVLFLKEPIYDVRTNSQMFKTPTLPRHLVQAHQANTELIEHIRDHWLYPPSKGPRRLYNPGRLDYSQLGQSLYVDKILRNRTDGFYVEAGACDGERRSNSLFFELYQDWNGLLVEPNPYLFKTILRKNRHAYMLNACLSSSKFPSETHFPVVSEHNSTTRYNNLPEDEIETSHHPEMYHSQRLSVQCFPLHSVLAAIGVTHVDYFSLDVKGAEVDILKTLPMQKVRFDIIGVEKRVFGSKELTKEKEAAIRKVLKPYGYKCIGMNKLDIFMAKV